MQYHRLSDRRTFRILAALLAILSILSFFPLTRSAVYAASSSQDKLKDIQKQLENVRSNRKQLAGQKDKLSGDLAYLEKRSQEQRSLYDAALEQKEAALMVLEMNQAASIQAQQDYENKIEEYEKRVAQMYAWNRQSMISMLLTSDSLQGFFTTLRFMKLVTEADEQALLELEEASVLAEQLAGDAELQYEEMAELVREADQAMNAIKQQESMTREELNKVSSSLEISRQKEAQLSRDEQAAKEAASKPAAPAAQTVAAHVGTAGFIWPIPGQHNISSHFGYRAKYGRFHYGTDVMAPRGTKIVAMANGVVTFASSGWNDGYGTVVMIDHGNGYQTRYAHLSGINCRIGQTVSAGQVIGYSGNTGNSSGPHLHFEIRMNGTPHNPMNYFKRSG